MRSQRAKTVVVVVCILMMIVVGTLLVVRLPHRQQLQVKKQKSPTTQLQAADVSAPGLVTGVLKTAQGQPLPGAVVYLSTARVTVPVYSDPSARVQSTVTGPDGRFAFSEETANRAVIVINEKGYGQATVADLAKTQELVLQAWAHVEGTLRQGKATLANQTIHLSRTRWGSKLKQQAFQTVHDTVTRTDAEGHYSFDRVAPGDTWISWRTDKGNYDVQYRYFDLQPGDSITADIGGHGRAITGRAALADGESKIKFYGSVWPKTLHQMRRRPNWAALLREEQDALTTAWESSADAKIFNQERCPVDFRIASDGSFTVPDLPAGAYRVVVATWTGAAGSSQIISRGQAEITIEDVTAGPSDEPQNIGTVEAFYMRPFAPGEPAPLFETTTLAGKPWKLADQKGKYLLLNFWRSDLPDLQQEIEMLKEVQAAWDKDKRVMLVGMNCDGTRAGAEKYITDSKLTWTQCFLGKESNVPQRYRLRGPATILIGPDGKIIRADLQAAEISDALKDSMGK